MIEYRITYLSVRCMHKPFELFTCFTMVLAEKRDKRALYRDDTLRAWKPCDCAIEHTMISVNGDVYHSAHKSTDSCTCFAKRTDERMRAEIWCLP